LTALPFRSQLQQIFFASSGSREGERRKKTTKRGKRGEGSDRLVIRYLNCLPTSHGPSEAGKEKEKRREKRRAAWWCLLACWLAPKAQGEKGRGNNHNPGTWIGSRDWRRSSADVRRDVAQKRGKNLEKKRGGEGRPALIISPAVRTKKREDRKKKGKWRKKAGIG